MHPSMLLLVAASLSFGVYANTNPLLDDCTDPTDPICGNIDVPVRSRTSSMAPVNTNPKIETVKAAAESGCQSSYKCSGKT